MKIEGNYQYKALEEGFYVQRNWHESKLLLVSLLGLENKKKDLVDIGCGSGNLLFKYSESFNSTSGIDSSEDAVSFLTSRLKELGIENSKAMVADLTGEVSIEKYDVGICMEVLEHFDLDTLKKSVVPNISKMIKKGGQLLITTPNRKSYWPYLEKALDFFKLVPQLADEQHLFVFSQNDLEKIMRQNGFKLVCRGSFNHVSPYVPLGLLRRFLLKTEVKYFKEFGPLLYFLAEKE